MLHFKKRVRAPGRRIFFAWWKCWKSVDVLVSRRYDAPMKDKGMGLVEMVVAMVIMATVGLAVASMVSTMSGRGVRKAGDGSLDLQALSYARANLEALRGAVSADPARSAPLAVSATSYNTTAAAGNTVLAALPSLPELPSSFRSAPVNGTRTYLVSSVGTSDLKKVKVTVEWDDV